MLKVKRNLPSTRDQPETRNLKICMPPDFTLILRSLREGKCILFLGPDVCLLPDGATTYFQTRVDLLRQKNLIRAYYEQDYLVQFQSETHRTRASYLIQDLYEVDAQQVRSDPPFYTPVYKKLLQLPFHLTISVSPDRFLPALMETYKIPYQFGYFDRRGPKAVEKPTLQLPLVYNLLGKADDFETLVLTYDDLYKYLVAVLNPNGLPDNLATALLPANFSHALFLGFPLNKWWVQLLLRLFGLNAAIETYAAAEDFDAAFEMFCKDNFNITLVRENVEDFVDELYAEAQQQRHRVQLRALQAPPAAGPPPEIFISYAWGGAREDIVNKLYDTLIAKGYNVIRDKINLGYKGNIQKFMQRIGAGQLVIVVISDKYLKSPNCMYEALEMERNANLQDRIFPIILDDARIYNAATQAEYLSYWENESETLRQKLAATNLTYTQPIIEQLNTYTEIRRIIANFMTLLQNMNAYTPEMHLEQNFQALIDALDARLAADQNLQPNP